jgi:glycine/D-amino acid oxidase-like deaminating enzyme
MDDRVANSINSTATNWYETTRVTSPAYSSLNVDLDVDVCVVGGGLAGLTVAREVALRGWSVAVLEAKYIARAASGQNTGFVRPGFDASIEAIIERVGLDRAKQLWALSEQGLHYVREVITNTKMPGVDPIPGWLHISKIDNDEAQRAHIERLRWLGADVQFWPKERVRTTLPNPRYFGAVYYPSAFHIHPLNYALGLAILAERAGVRIFEQTPAVSMDSAGARKRIATPNARVRASHIVLAGNVHIGPLMPRLAATLLPVTTFVLVSQPIANLSEVIRYPGAISSGHRADNHCRIVDGDRLQWAGGLRTWQADPLNQQQGLLTDIRRNFPALGSVRADHVWSGTMGRTIHRMPQIGEMEEGVWMASGFGGHGLNTTAMAGELIARGIVDGDQTWHLFDPYALVWAGGALGRALVQGRYWASRPIERVSGALALRRERKQAPESSAPI